MTAKHYYEAEFTSEFLLTEEDRIELKQLIVDFLSPGVNTRVSINYIDTDGYDVED